MIPRLINVAWAASMRGAEKRFRNALQRPAETQRELLHSIISRNTGTAFGEDHCFDQINSVEDFQRQVPLGDYSDHDPYITSIRHGEQRVLTADTVTHLIPTSGSSSARKLIPHTMDLQGQFDAALGPWVRDMFRRFPGAGKGRAYWSVSPAIPNDEQSAVTIGFQDDTDYLSPIGRLLIRHIFAVPSDVRHITDTEKFWRSTALQLLAVDDLSLISVWHPSYLNCLLDFISTHWDELLEELPRSAVTRLAKTTPDAVHEIWPQLALVSVWADASASLPFARMQERMPRIEFQPKGLLATEGWTSIPYQGQHPLAITSHFFEFIDAAGEPRLCDQLEQGQCYETVLTTAGGLYRYRTGDRVQVTGMLGATPKLKFVGRDSATSDLCGEKLHESHICECLLKVYKETDYYPVDQVLVPKDANAPTKYILLMCGPIPPPDAIEEQLEDALRANPHYALARKLGQLDHVEVAWQPNVFRKLSSTTNSPIGSVKPSVLCFPEALPQLLAASSKQ
ncbi:MAG: GH3 auxin-responsive promoter family protein [Planctomycetota bacterium]